MPLGFAAVLVLIASDAPSRVRETAYARVAVANAIQADAQIRGFVASHNALRQSSAEIQRKDKAWIADAAHPLRKELTRNACATLLRALVEKDPLIAEAILMDDQGALVCASAETSDYWQGDETKWQKTCRDGQSVFIDEPALDASSGRYAIQLSVPVFDGGKRIGALTLTLKLSQKALAQPGSR